MVNPPVPQQAADPEAGPTIGTQVPQAVIEMTGAGIVTSWNPAAVLLYGYQAAEIVGHPADVLCPPANREGEAAVLRRITAGGGGERYEANRVCKDGTTIRALLTAEPVTGPDGAVVGVTTASREAGGQATVEVRTDVERSEVTADAERREHRDDVERTEVTADAERREHRDGVERSEVTADAERRVDRDGVERTEVTADAERRVDRDGVERSEVTADAERRKGRGKLERTEVTAGAKRREGRGTLERSEVTAGAKRREGRGTLERTEVTAGAERRETRDGVERSEVTADAERREARDGVERTEVTADAERREARDTLERSEVTADAKRREARDMLERSEVTADAERRGDRDSLERKERMQAQAQRLESLGQLAGGVAHDFNNLLAVILNYVSFVSEEVAAAADGSDPAQHLEAASADLEQVKKAAERAARLTHQLLVFARRDVIRPQVLDLDKVITAVEEMLRRTIGEHVELVTSLAGDLWPVLADPGQLEQVLVNLAVNARDAMPTGGTLTIDTSNILVDSATIAGGSKAREGRNVRLRVGDSGTGMPPEIAQHAFEPFFTTKPDGAGTGLGLATVYGILTQADGTIGIYSEPGVGTNFTITLPATAETAGPVVEPVPYHRVPKGETVLIVEDEEALREVTRRIFTRNGFHVITAANGPEALGIARDHEGEIHLLVTDVVMPHMLGKEVAEKMRLIKPEIEVIFMSGYARPVLASQGRLEKGVALVEKPFSESDLLATVGQVLNGNFQGFRTIEGTPKGDSR